MQDLISRSALLKIIEEKRSQNPFYNSSTRDAIIWDDYFRDFASITIHAPAVDAEVVRHGRWIMRGGYIRCSECDAKTLWKDTGGTGGFSHEYEQVRSVHCHNCGAKMDGEQNDIQRV